MPDITAAGAVPTSLTALNSELLAIAVAQSPSLTANLPGSMVEDMSSTATGALAVADQAAVDLINSVSPQTANETILYQLGVVYGVEQGQGSNTSVYVVFSGPPGFAIAPGFLVGDGTHQYVTRDPAIISGPGPIGTSAATFCEATQAGSWAVPANTVNSTVTSVPSSIAESFSFTNPDPGLPGAAPQTTAEYQAQVIQAGQAKATGIITLLRTALQQVNGVQARLISVRQVSGNWEIIVGGGDPYQVAGAIFQSMFNILNLTGAESAGTTQTVAINDYPDTYTIVFVVPAQQSVGMTITWNTIATANFVSDAIVVALVQPAMVSYINSIPVGHSISLLELQDVFITAVAGSIPEGSLSKLQFVVTIDGNIVNPPSGGVLISGDPEGYFLTAAANIALVQG